MKKLFVMLAVLSLIVVACSGPSSEITPKTDEVILPTEEPASPVDLDDLSDLDELETDLDLGLDDIEI